MLDKQVVMCDFKNIKSGMLVRIHEDWRDFDLDGGEVCLVLDRITIPRMIDEGSCEAYDPALLLIANGKRTVVSVDAVKEVLD